MQIQMGNSLRGKVSFCVGATPPKAQMLCRQNSVVNQVTCKIDSGTDFHPVAIDSASIFEHTAQN